MVTRKVFDIIPPRGSKEPVLPAQPPEKPSFSAKLALPSKETAKNAPKKESSIDKRAFWWPSLTILAILVIGSAGYFLIKPKAELEIWPVKTPLQIKTQIIVGGDIAGEVKTQDCSSSQEFPSTGEKSIITKASGTIRVYNAYATSPQTLIANTRFVSDGGKLFRTPQKTVIPGARYEGSKLVPGEIDAKAEAGEPGEEYNIGPSTFSLPALAGTSRYTAFYAKSFSPMSGGLKMTVAQVSEADLANAEKVLKGAALDGCAASLKDSLPAGEYFVEEEAVKSEIVKIEPSVEEGQEISAFTLNVKAKAIALVFKRSDLSDFAQAYISTKVPEGKQLDGNSVAVSYLPQSIDLERGKIILAVEISAEIYPTIDETRIKEAVRTQTPDEIAASLKQLPEIDRFQLRLWPFWVNRTPLETAGIAVKLRLD